MDRNSLIGTLLAFLISIPAYKWVLGVPGPYLNLLLSGILAFILIGKLRFGKNMLIISMFLFLYLLVFLFYAIIFTGQYFSDYMANIFQLCLNLGLAVLLLGQPEIQKIDKHFGLAINLTSFVIIFNYFGLGTSTTQTANYLTITLPIGLALSLSVANQIGDKLTLMGLLKIAVFSMSILSIGGRGPLVASILVVAFVLFLSLNREGAILRALLILGLMTFLTVVAFIFNLINPWMLFKIIESFSSSGGSEPRALVYGETIKLIELSPFLGNGFAAPTLIDLPWNVGIKNPHVDSFALELLLNYGAVAIPLLLLVFYPLLIRKVDWAVKNMWVAYLYLTLNYLKSWSLADASIIFLVIAVLLNKRFSENDIRRNTIL